MAIKQYQSYTLTDNWFEERGAAAAGVMPDYGDRCFTTQASQDYPLCGGADYQQAREARETGAW